MKQWKHKCELQLLVCEPNPLRPDRVTVGFVLRDSNPENPRVEVKFASNLRAIRCIYPDVDLEAISGALNDLKPILKQVTDIDQYLQHLPQDFPVHFNFLSSTALLTDSIEAELPLLEKQYLSTLKAAGGDSAEEREPEQIGRAYIRRRMQQEFVPLLASGLLTEEIAVSDYTFDGDRLKIDFGYWRDRDDRMMHATSVVTGLEQTAILAVKWRDIRKSVERKIEGRCELMSVIEDSPFTESPQAHAAQRWLMEEGIEVRRVKDLAEIGTGIRRELKL
jgi:hypothetical protein